MQPSDKDTVPWLWTRFVSSKTETALAAVEAALREVEPEDAALYEDLLVACGRLLQARANLTRRNGDG